MTCHADNSDLSNANHVCDIRNKKRIQYYGGKTIPQSQCNWVRGVSATIRASSLKRCLTHWKANEPLNQYRLVSHGNIKIQGWLVWRDLNNLEQKWQMRTNTQASVMLDYGNVHANTKGRMTYIPSQHFSTSNFLQV